MSSEDIIRETQIFFERGSEKATIYTTFPYIAKQLEKMPEAKLIASTVDPKGNYDDSWEFEIPIQYFFYKGRLRLPRRIDEGS